MNDRKRIKKVLEELELTHFKEITPILLSFGFDRAKAQTFLRFMTEQQLVELKNDSDLNWISLKGKTVFLENLNIGAKMTLNGEKYLHENLTFFEKIKSEWWKLVLVNIPGIFIGALITYFITSSDHQKNQNNLPIENENQIEKSDSISMTGIKDGRWISTTDSLAGIEIKNGKWIILYKGMETDSTNIYKYKITIGNSNFADSEPSTGKFVTLVNSLDTLKYEILKLEKDFLGLLPLPNGGLHIYKPEK